MYSKKTNKKIIVFESDDWGSIRTPSLSVVKAVNKIEPNIGNDVYTRFDTLENYSDIEEIINILIGFNDQNKKHPVLTANYVTVNPDFEAIANSGYKDYSYNTFDKTYQKYYPNEQVLAGVKRAIDLNVFYPQFHGREHVNVLFWFQLLKDKDPVFIEAFKQGFWGLKTNKLKKWNKSIQASFDLNETEQTLYIENALEEGLKIFEAIFGFRSRSFIPNNYIWPTKYNKLLKALGIDYLQGTRIQLSPQKQLGDKRESVKRNPGYKEKGDLISIVRNGSFEPSFYPVNRRKALDMCLADIEAAFRFKQPAVISTHRINFVSGLSVQNRDENLKLLDELLITILKKWPDVQFMNTVELGDLYKNMNG